MKLARIMSGNSFDKDHWHDMAGYASLVVREIERRDVEYQIEISMAQAAQQVQQAQQAQSMQEMIKEIPDGPRE
jgi:hypothetical protein